MFILNLTNSPSLSLSGRKCRSRDEIKVRSFCADDALSIQSSRSLQEFVSTKCFLFKNRHQCFLPDLFSLFMARANRPDTIVVNSVFFWIHPGRGWKFYWEMLPKWKDAAAAQFLKSNFLPMAGAVLADFYLYEDGRRKVSHFFLYLPGLQRPIFQTMGPCLNPWLSRSGYSQVHRHREGRTLALTRVVHLRSDPSAILLYSVLCTP